jgi:hypothetical protein
MKSTRIICVVFAFAAAGSVIAQGPLTPPPSYDPTLGPLHAVDGAGLPQPTMKTLHQVEPRTALAAGQPGVTAEPNGGFTIAIPGSYYLTGRIEVASGNGITILADRVTLDLNGYSIISNSSAPSGIGIEVQGFHTGISVRNGTIIGGTQSSGTAQPLIYTERGFAGGLKAAAAVPGTTAGGASVENLYVTGCAGPGLSVPGGRFQNCRVSDCTGKGIEGTLGPVVVTPGPRASGSSAVDCTVSRCGGGYGIVVDGPVTRCYAGLNMGTGILGISLQDCVASSNRGTGLRGYHVTGCHAHLNEGIGIHSQTVTDSTSSENIGDGIWTVHARGCISNASGGFGILSQTATDCRVDESGATGINCEIASRCIATRGLGSGIIVNSTAEGCRASDNAVVGIYTFGNAVNCSSDNNLSYGIKAEVATGCTATANGTYGIFATIATHCLASNNTTEGIAGVNISFCSSTGNTQNYLLFGGGVSNFNN